MSLDEIAEGMFIRTDRERALNILLFCTATKLTPFYLAKHSIGLKMPKLVEEEYIELSNITINSYKDVRSFFKEKIKH